MSHEMTLQTLAEQLHETIYASEVAAGVVEAVYADRNRSQRQLEDFEFLVSKPDRDKWVKNALAYAKKYNISGSNIYETIREVRNRRKEKRQAKGARS